MDVLEALKDKNKELRCALDRCQEEKMKIGILYEETLKEKKDLEKKIDFLSGQCEAFKFCISEGKR